MNNLKTNFTAPVPIEWDDIEWMQQAFKDSFNSLISGIGDTFIISGCEVTEPGGDILNVAAGWVAIDGEILKVAAQSIDLSGGGSAQYLLEEVDDPTGSESDLDGNTVECYQVRRAKLVSAGGSLSAFGDKLSDKFKSLVFDSETSWTQATLGANFSHVIGNEVKYRINKIGNVEIMGQFTATTEEGNLFTLPSAYRPSKEQWGVLFHANYTTNMLEIHTDGIVKIPVGQASIPLTNYINITLMK